MYLVLLARGIQNADDYVPGALYLHSQSRVLGKVPEPCCLPLASRNIDIQGEGPACRISSRPHQESDEAEKACFEKEFHVNFVAPQANSVKKFQTAFVRTGD